MPFCGYLFKRALGFRLQSNLLLFSNLARILSFGYQFSGIVATRTRIGKCVVGYTPSEIIFGLPAKR